MATLPLPESLNAKSIPAEKVPGEKVSGEKVTGEKVTMNSTASLLEVLKRYWGYDSFRALQQSAMESCLEGRDSVVILPTGGGKSLCFQAPALCLPGLTLVVSPLISLMKDQVDTLRECGIPAAQLNSSLSPEEKRTIMAQIDRNELKLLYIAPERLAVERTIEYFKTVKISMIAIDEAHCISAWGHDFRPEYRMLGELKKHFPGIGVHAYTATASERVREDIAQQLKLDLPKWIIGNFDRPNLTYRVVAANQRFEQVLEMVRNHPGESGIIYCISRKEVDKFASALSGIGIRALPYHAGLSDEERKQNQEAFVQDRCDIIVATVAFGMGIDKPDVRYVIHAAAPKSLEHYQQESGRAGRDGLEAECTLFYSNGDFVTWSKIIEAGFPESVEGQKRSLDSIRAYCSSSRCRHRHLVEFLGQRFDGERCNACDICLEEIEQVEDPIRIGQMILSCVLRLREKYGVDYTGKVLIGSNEARILQAGHDKLSTFGLLSEHSLSTVKGWIDHLVEQGFLEKSKDEYPILKVTESGRLLLRGEASPRLPKEASRAAGPKAGRASTTVSWEGVDRGLFEHLKGIRSRLASERGIPAFAIFADATLRALATMRPSTLDRMALVHGIGDRKLADLGATFLSAIESYCRSKNLSQDETLSQTNSARSSNREQANESVAGSRPQALSPSAIAVFPYFEQGHSIETICDKLKKSRSTVIRYLNDYCSVRAIESATPWVPAEEIDLIEKAIVSTGSVDRLRPLFDHLEEKISYDSIRIALTCYRNRQKQPE